MENKLYSRSKSDLRVHNTDTTFVCSVEGCHAPAQVVGRCHGEYGPKDICNPPIILCVEHDRTADMFTLHRFGPSLHSTVINRYGVRIPIP